jgi:hypothetical protein
MSISGFCQKYVFNQQASNSMLLSDEISAADTASASSSLDVDFLPHGSTSRKIILRAIATSPSGHEALFGR